MDVKKCIKAFGWGGALKLKNLLPEYGHGDDGKYSVIV